MIPNSKEIKITQYTKDGFKNTAINAIGAYNSLGYFEATISIKNNKSESNSENNNKERIDGGFMIDVYDNDEKIAFGYVSDGNWKVDDCSDVGFKSEINKEIVFKIIDSKKILPNKKYTIKLSNPNLWTVII